MPKPRKPKLSPSIEVRPVMPEPYPYAPPFSSASCTHHYQVGGNGSLLIYENIIYEGNLSVSVIFTCADCGKELIIQGEVEER